MLFAAIGSLTLPRSAAAARYAVVQCHSGYTAAHQFGFGTFHPATFSGQDRCGAASALSVRAQPFTSVPFGFGGGWAITAPDGTAFTRFQASFQGGSNGSAHTAPEAHVCGDVWCQTWITYFAFGNGGDTVRPPGIPGWGSPGVRSWSGDGGRVISFGLACAYGACSIGQWGAGIDMFSPQMELNDYVHPGAPNITVPGGWRAGRVAAAYTASDRGSGVRRVHAVAGGITRGSSSHACHAAGSVYTRLVPCPLSAQGSVSVDTRVLEDGPRQIRLVAEDASGQQTWGPERTLLVDNHAPTAPETLAVDGGEGWRRANQFDVSWTNPRGQHAPIIRARYTLCSAGGESCSSGSVGGAGIDGLSGVSVAGDGEWALRVALEDAAGNVDSAHPSEPLYLRLDSQAPERVEFLPQDPEDPQRIEVAVEDSTSGVAGGRIELRPEGGAWRALATSLVGGERLVARVNDTGLTPGFYELRAIARDQAGNERSSQDGPQSGRRRVYLPARLRARVALRARRPTCAQLNSAAGPRRRARRCRSGFLRARRNTVLLRFGGRALVSGRVETIDGVAIPGGRVEVLYRHRATDAEPRPIATLDADEQGGFRFLIPRAPSGSFSFRFPGSSRFGPGGGELLTRVRGSLAFRASERRARNGDTVVFSGRLRGRPLPATGRTVDVQAFVPGFGWRTFATPRTDRRGRFRVPYRFRFTSGLQRYRLRALLEPSGDYPYERAVSRVVRVTVRG